MTYISDYTLPQELLEDISSEGFDVLPQLITTVLNTAMRLERQKYLGAEPYQRSESRVDYANGYKPKTVATRVGKLTVDVPQVREGDFYPSALEKGTRSERALKIALAEMYIQGVSTRKVAAITEQMCGFEVSCSQVSAATAQLDEQFNAWRERPLGQMRYLYLDARYEKVRQDGVVKDIAVLIATGVNDEGKREVLGVSTATSEHEVHWREFLKSLVKRGIHGIELIISDAHSGLKSAKTAVLGGVPWQRCQAHLQRNAQAYVPKIEMKAQVAAEIRAIFNAPNQQNADAMLNQIVDKYNTSAPKLALWLEENIPQGLTIFAFPQTHQRLIRTTNGLERLNREIKRRTQVVSIFPNDQSCLRLVTAIVSEISDDWLAAKTYIKLSQQ
jgi:transposase-like protein